MKIGIANDHSAVDMKNEIKEYLESKGYEVVNFGTDSKERCNYPVYGEAVANAVVSGEVDCGVLICGTGVVISLAANKVNGIRACVTKGFKEFFNEANADIFCIQETKCQPEQVELKFEGYKSYWNSAERKGYSGTAIFTKKQPVNVTYGIGIEEHDKEGRIITLEFENFYLVTNYTPNAKRELERLDYRMVWEDEIRKYLLELNKKKPVIMCGDLNVAHEEIDLKNPKTNKGNAGFTNEEREKMTELLNAGFIDSYRYLYPEKIEYSWWSYMGHAREKNVGWRIDYFIVSNDFRENIKDATIYTEILGSDHCPVGLEIK